MAWAEQLLFGSALVLCAAALAAHLSARRPRRGLWGFWLVAGAGFVISLPLAGVGAAQALSDLAPKAAATARPLAVASGTPSPTARPTLTATSVAPSPTSTAVPPRLTSTATAAPTATPPPVRIEIATGGSSFGVAMRNAGRTRYSDAEIERALGMRLYSRDACAAVFVKPATSHGYDAGIFQAACAFVLATLRLQAPSEPVPLFLRDQQQAERGEVPLAGPAVIAINTTPLSREAMIAMVAHEETHAVSGVGRPSPDACIEEGVAEYVEHAINDRQADLLAAARQLAVRDRLVNPRALRDRAQMYGGGEEAVALHYAACGAFVAYLYNGQGGQKALAQLHATGALPGQDLDQLAAAFVAAMRR